MLSVITILKIPNHMFMAKTFAPHGIRTSGNFTYLLGFVSSANMVIGDFQNFFLDIFRNRWIKLSIAPIITMKFSDVFRMSLAQNKILYTIISFVAIQMMNLFLRFQFSTQVLFHNMSMMKYSFTTDIDTQITKWSDKRLSFFEIIPIRRYFVATMPPPSRVMRGAYKLTIFSNLFAMFDCTSNVHINNSNKL